MPRALVTGGTGFIGSNIALRLIERRWDVRILERPGASVAHVARMTGRTRDEIRDVAGELAAEGLINMKRGMLYG